MSHCLPAFLKWEIDRFEIPMSNIIIVSSLWLAGHLIRNIIWFIGIEVKGYAPKKGQREKEVVATNKQTDKKCICLPIRSAFQCVSHSSLNLLLQLYGTRMGRHTDSYAKDRMKTQYHLNVHRSFFFISLLSLSHWMRKPQHYLRAFTSFGLSSTSLSVVVFATFVASSSHKHSSDQNWWLNLCNYLHHFKIPTATNRRGNIVK